MERVASVEERIRRAEEIYNNRRKIQNGIRVSTSRVTTSPTKSKYILYKKLIAQIICCFLIYIGLYTIKNSNYIFSESFIGKTKEFISYDIDFQNTYNLAFDYYNNNLKKYFIPNLNDQENEKEQNDDLDLVNEINENVVSDAIGGGEDEKLPLNLQVKQASSQAVMQLSQMEIDANDIKNKYNLILPLKGIVSSRFGPRQGSKIVSSNHAGIDIAADEGTVFVSAMAGTVIVASSEGSYGNHLFIQDNDVLTVYAHCKKLYVKEGDKIEQGQKLGEVGQTGNATGPHLHFEIRKDNRCINPEMILQFG